MKSVGETGADECFGRRVEVSDVGAAGKGDVDRAISGLREGDTIIPNPGDVVHEGLKVNPVRPADKVVEETIVYERPVVPFGELKERQRIRHPRRAEELVHLEQTTEESLKEYVAWAQGQGFKADYRMAVGTEAVETVEEMCRILADQFPRAIFFMGRLIFREEKWFHRLLHNETPNAIQRRLQFDGLQAIVLPIRVLPT